MKKYLTLLLIIICNTPSIKAQEIRTHVVFGIQDSDIINISDSYIKSPFQGNDLWKPKQYLYISIPSGVKMEDFLKNIDEWTFRIKNEDSLFREWKKRVSIYIKYDFVNNNFELYVKSINHIITNLELETTSGLILCFLNKENDIDYQSKVNELIEGFGSVHFIDIIDFPLNHYTLYPFTLSVPFNSAPLVMDRKLVKNIQGFSYHGGHIRISNNFLQGASMELFANNEIEFLDSIKVQLNQKVYLNSHRYINFSFLKLAPHKPTGQYVPRTRYNSLNLPAEFLENNRINIKPDFSNVDRVVITIDSLTNQSLLNKNLMNDFNDIDIVINVNSENKIDSLEIPGQVHFIYFNGDKPNFKTNLFMKFNASILSFESMRGISSRSFIRILARNNKNISTDYAYVDRFELRLITIINPFQRKRFNRIAKKGIETDLSF